MVNPDVVSVITSGTGTAAFDLSGNFAETATGSDTISVAQIDGQLGQSNVHITAGTIDLGNGGYFVDVRAFAQARTRSPAARAPNAVPHLCAAMLEM